ncbi:phasin family protein [Rhodoferax ferrireducens]|uniref:phasin family protein n=1 Tax=Rhodoferax ferrireducens TaxID=192843 RepID=UPI000E0DB91E|nr:phasin family protein [Rhodoferax ferrireducens]
MTYTVEQLIAARQANLKMLEGLTTRAYASFEKLVALNLAASRDLFMGSFGHTQALLGAKHPQQLAALQVGLIQPLTEKSIAYGRNVYSVVAETGSEFSKAGEAQIAQAQTALVDLVENLAQNAPAGTQSTVAAFRSAVNVSQNVIESAKRSAKKAVELAESNFTAVTTQAVNAATTVSKTR